MPGAVRHPTSFVNTAWDFEEFYNDEFQFKRDTKPYTKAFIMIVISRNAFAFRKSRFYRLLEKLFFINTILHYLH